MRPVHRTSTVCVRRQRRSADGFYLTGDKSFKAFFCDDTHRSTIKNRYTALVDNRVYAVPRHNSYTPQFSRQIDRVAYISILVCFSRILEVMIAPAFPLIAPVYQYTKALIKTRMMISTRIVRSLDRVLVPNHDLSTKKRRPLTNQFSLTILVSEQYL